MTTVTVPVTTFWDVLAYAMYDPVFWYLFVGGVVSASLLTRFLVRRARGDHPRYYR